ncbi:hypothetical protein BE25_0226 [Staphylococcus phage vB_SepM_BE25]|nr:hypothetical protein BE25_0226 [Staphylococcus phage vB_SepM_BE25]
MGCFFCYPFLLYFLTLSILYHIKNLVMFYCQL